MFELMKELSDILRHRRHERGSIDFDFPESKIIVENRKETLYQAISRCFDEPEFLEQLKNLYYLLQNTKADYFI